MMNKNQHKGSYLLNVIKVRRDKFIPKEMMYVNEVQYFLFIWIPHSNYLQSSAGLKTNPLFLYIIYVTLLFSVSNTICLTVSHHPYLTCFNVNIQ